jgi:hypothetical protein
MIKTLSVKWFRRTKWRFLGSLPRGVKNCVIVVGPHAHRNDLKIASAIVALTHFRCTFIADKRYNNWFVRRLLRDLRILYIHFSKSADHFDLLHSIQQKDPYKPLVFCQNHLWSGIHKLDYTYYDFAVKSKSTIMLVAIDHRRKVVKFHNPFELSGVAERDLSYISAFFKNYYSYVQNGYLYGAKKGESVEILSIKNEEQDDE